MLISTNNKIPNNEFEDFLDNTLLTLDAESKRYPNKYQQLLGNKLEGEVFDVMTTEAVGSSLEGTIELISGQRFPDIIADQFYGVEVKTTKLDHWTTTGNSVMESTRVDGIEKIYMLFGKMIEPIEFRYRPYEECLSDVVVTHSPRYAIDMELGKGQTIFDKIDITYGEIRKSENPIKPFKEYYRNRLKDGQELWWLDVEQYTPDSMVFKLWNTLSSEEKNKIRLQGFAYFPDIFGKRQDKFDQVTLWLSVHNRIVCPNVRDLFTAGGKKSIVVDGFTLRNLPKVLWSLIKNIDSIADIINNTSLDSLIETTRINYTDKEEYKKLWVKNVVNSAMQIYKFGYFNLHDWLSKKV